MVGIRKRETRSGGIHASWCTRVRNICRSQLFRFYLVGGASAGVYLLLFLIFRVYCASQIANMLALLLSAIANTAVNRRFTFGIRGPAGIIRQYLQGLVVFALGLVVTSGALLVLHSGVPEPSRMLEVSVLVAANLIATIVRFLGLRRVFSGEHVPT
ncbi:GtrA family protein [Rhodococcus sp. AQ5-07]|uniref:GtrA family protein n=1 Tax=Rhodococcus sp. AQ5-07 TaxID=2054902 RepID=UPI0013B3A1BD|nr:GtrA family protein [Rhodococcus sp. AQ5-07]